MQDGEFRVPGVGTSGQGFRSLGERLQIPKATTGTARPQTQNSKLLTLHPETLNPKQPKALNLRALGLQLGPQNRTPLPPKSEKMSLLDFEVTREKKIGFIS